MIFIRHGPEMLVRLGVHRVGVLNGEAVSLIKSSAMLHAKRCEKSKGSPWTSQGRLCFGKRSSSCSGIPENSANNAWLWNVMDLSESKQRISSRYC